MATYEAVLCTKYGPPKSLELKRLPELKAEPGQVVVDVHACGVNFPDVLIIQNKYQFKPPLPFSPGGELTGIVKEIGEGVTHVKVGDAVICMTGWGGFAEQCSVASESVVLLPKNMNLVVGAGFTMTYGTSYHALVDRAKVQKGETVLVLGAAGGVGITAVELSKLMGARVIAAASTNEKLLVCKQHGADEVINYTTENLREKINKITNGKGVDVIYDPIGGSLAEEGIRSMAWNGRYLVIGFASGPIPKIPFNLYLLKGCAVLGVFWGRFRGQEPKKAANNIKQLLTWYQDGKLKPLISKTYPLSEAWRALEDLEQRKVTGKVVITTKHYSAIPAKL